MIIWKIANTEIVDRTGNYRKTVCGSWKGKHICFIEAKGNNNGRWFNFNSTAYGGNKCLYGSAAAHVTFTEKFRGTQRFNCKGNS